jgi:chromosome segregation ATPase
MKRGFHPISTSLFATLAATGAAFSQEEKVTFQDHVLPILESKCLNCHNPDEAKGGLDLSTFGATMTGGSGGEVAIAEDPLGSRLYSLMAHREEPYMPPQKPKAPDEELKVIAAWIAGGMLETKSSKARKSDKPKLGALVANTGKPDGPPPMPENLILQPAVITERANSVGSLAHSPWAPIVAVAGQKQVLLYHSGDFELLGVLPYPEGFPQALSFSANGSLVVCGGGRAGKSGNVVAWDVKTGERVIEVGKEFDDVLGAAISPDHKQVVLGGPDKNIKLWDTVTGEQTNMIKKHPDWMLTAAYSPDGVLFATGGRNADLYVWEGGTGFEFYTMKGHTLSVTDVDWRGDSNLLASCSLDGQVILWEMSEGKEVKKWAAHSGGTHSVDFAPDGRIVTGGRDKTVKIWTADGTQQRVINASDDFVMSVAFTEDSKRVISGDYNGKVIVWNAEDGTKLAELSSNPPTIDKQLAYSQQRITEISTNLPKLEEAAKAAGTKVAESRAKLEATKKGLAENTAKKAAMDKQAADSDAKIKALAPQQQKAQAELTAKQGVAKQKNDQLTAVTQTLTAAKADADKWMAEFKKLEATVAPLVAAVAAAKAESEKPLLDAASQKALTDAIAARNAAATGKQQADAAVAPKQKAAQDAQAKVAAADAGAKAAAAKLAEASKNGAQPAPEIVAAKQQADTALQQAQAALTAANTAVAQAQAAQAEAAKKVAAAETAVKPLVDKETAAKTAQTAAKAAFAAKTAEHQKAVAAAAAAKTQSDAAAKKFADTDTQAKAAQAAKTTADADAAKAGTLLADLNKGITDANTAKAAGQKEAQAAAQQIDALTKAQDPQSKEIEALAKAEADAKKVFETAKAELGTSQYLVRKWEAAAVNVDVKKESDALGDMEEKLGDMEEKVAAVSEEHKKAAAALTEAQTALTNAQKTVTEGKKALATRTSSIMETVLQLAAAKAAAGIKGGDAAAVNDPELQAKLAQLEALIAKSYQEADATRKAVAQATEVAAKTPPLVAERTKIEDVKESEAKAALAEKQAHEAAVAAQKKKIEELRQKYLSLAPKKEVVSGNTPPSAGAPAPAAPKKEG